MESDIVKRLFYTMLRIRIIEEKIAEVYPKQEMRCPVHLSIGQEATAAGVCGALEKSDYAMSTHRSHAHYLAKGGDLKRMIAELYGRKSGCCMGKGGSMHLIDKSVNFYAVPIVGSTIPIAVGTVFPAMKTDRNRVSVAFFGDAAVEEGVFSESLNFAALKKLPVIFVCENNFFSVYSPLNVRQPKSRSNIKIAEGHGIEGISGDGNNVKEVYEIANAAVQKARNGSGPTYLEFTTYRWLEHCGPYYDNNLGYRSESEFESWKARDPIALFSRDLDQSWIDSITRDISEEIQEAIVAAKDDPFPDTSMLSRHIYAD